MKKISLVAMACVISASVMAQSTETDTKKDYKPMRTPMSSAVRFGITAGLNMSKFSYNDKSGTGFSTTMKAGPMGGLFVNIPLGPVRIQPGLTYNIYGSKYTQTGTTITSGGTTVTTGGFAGQEDLHYLSVPVAIQIVPGNSGFFIEAGPQANFLIAAKFHDQTPGSNGSNDGSNKAAFDNFDFSAFGGLGYITRIGLGFSAKYNVGFNNVLNDDQAPAMGGASWKNRSWTFGLFYHFGAAK